MSNTKVITDNLSTKDNIIKQNHESTFRTQIIAGYDMYVDEMGVTKFGTTVFETENMTLLGGSIFTLEKLVNKWCEHPKIPTLKDILDMEPKDGANQTIWTDDSTPSEYGGHPENNVLYLFGVGIGGAGESIANVKDVKYTQRNIDEMIPLRTVTNDTELSVDEHEKYFCRIKPSSDIVQYYLKRFDSVDIKCKRKDSDDEASGSDVGDEYYMQEDNIPIDTYLELKLTISKKDVREYFASDIEKARINTIGLYTAIPVELKTPITVAYDPLEGNTYHRTMEYDHVKCFSAFNFDNEMLSLPKDLTILYRIFAK